MNMSEIMIVRRSSISLHIFYFVLLLLLVRISMLFYVSITNVMSKIYVYKHTGAISRPHTICTQQSTSAQMYARMCMCAKEL